MTPRGARKHRPAGRSRHGWTRATGLLLAAAAVMLLWPEAAMACPVCYGDTKTPMTDGANNGILVLLGIVGGVQTGFVALFWSFWRRIRNREKLRLETERGSLRSNHPTIMNLSD